MLTGFSVNLFRSAQPDGQSSHRRQRRLHRGERCRAQVLGEQGEGRRPRNARLALVGGERGERLLRGQEPAPPGVELKRLPMSSKGHISASLDLGRDAGDAEQAADVVMQSVGFDDAGQHELFG